MKFKFLKKFLQNQGIANELEKWEDAIWCSLMTITTIGFGDYYQISDEDRMFVYIICLLGLVFNHE